MPSYKRRALVPIVKEYLEALEEFGPDSFNLALTFPAIPIVQEIDLGKYELLEYLAKLPSRS